MKIVIVKIVIIKIVIVHFVTSQNIIVNYIIFRKVKQTLKILWSFCEKMLLQRKGYGFFRGCLVHGEKKSRWTKQFSVEVWSMERKRAGGPNGFQREYGPRREKVRVDQIVFCGSLVQGEEKCGWTK